jgi:hypothetical protein
MDRRRHQRAAEPVIVAGTRSSRLGQVLRATAVLLAFVGVWFTLIRPPRSVAAMGIDDSWVESYGHLLTDGLRLGHDLAFTHGPLGYFSRPHFDERLFWPALLFEVIWKGALAVVFVRAALATRSLAGGALFLFLMVAFVARAVDAEYFLACALLVFLSAATPARLGNRLAGMLILATMALLKFSFAIAVLPCVLAITLITWRQLGARALWIPIDFLVVFLAGWVLARQQIGDLPAYLVDSHQIASGYSAAMSTWGLPDVLACCVVALITSWMVAALHVWFEPTFVRCTAALTWIVISWLSFKAGFVTQDMHVLTTIWCLAPMTIVLALATRTGRRIGGVKLLLTAVTLAACFTSAWRAGPEFGWTEKTYPGIWWTGLQKNALLLGKPGLYFSGLRGQVDPERRKYDLPRTREAVGNRPVDIFDWEQGVLFLNRFQWRPRPVLHGYLTYTPELVKRNGDFMRGERAPSFVLFKLQPLRTDFWPTMADAASLDVLMHAYEPVLTENGYLLLRRKEGPRVTLVTEHAPDLELTAEVGRRQILPALPAGDTYLGVALPLTREGELVTTLYKPPAVFLMVAYDDGTSLRARIVPGMVENGILISPAFRTTRAVGEHYQGGRTPAVQAVTIEVPVSPSCYAREAHLRLWVDRP